jgi:hypothetical protein
LKPRELFLDACTALAEEFAADGFKATGGGQKLKRSSPDRDRTCELYFQSSFRNDGGHVTLIPQVWVKSKAVKKWWTRHHPDGLPNDMVFCDQLGNLTPLKAYTVWNVAGGRRSLAIAEVAGLIREYALPIARLFDDPKAAISQLRTQGVRFNPHMKNDSLRPLPFLLCFGTKDDAEQFLKLYVEACTYAADIYKLYRSLKKATEINLRYSEFIGAGYVKLAYLHGLALPS